jgi:hypothetical protein
MIHNIIFGIHYCSVSIKIQSPWIIALIRFYF